MLRFKHFLEALGWSFGRETKPSSKSRGLPLAQTLSIGWAAEDFVISVIERLIGPVVKSSEREDRGAAKVDAHITNRHTGQTVTAQIKARESGDDILVKWFRDYPRVPGDGQSGAAELYVTMNSDRSRIYLLSAAAVKAECQRLVAEWQKKGQAFYVGDTGEVRTKQEEVGGRPVLSVTVFLRPDAVRMKAGLPGWPNSLAVPQAMRQQPTALVTLRPRHLAPAAT
jgi:hypothetical protein